MALSSTSLSVTGPPVGQLSVDRGSLRGLKRVLGWGLDVRDWSRPEGAPPPRSPRPPLGAPGRSGLVEHDGLWVLVGHLGHVTQDIFFCDNTKEPPAGGDKEKGRGGREHREKKGERERGRGDEDKEIRERERVGEREKKGGTGG